MSKYHVYGIGNALVDTEIEVEPSFLQKVGVEKGLMTLVDEDRQDELWSMIHSKIHKQSCGGSAANTMIALAQLGGKGFYSCKVANDATGDFYGQDLISEGLATNLKDERPEGKTGRCMVFITPDADRTMNTFLGITSTFSEEEIIEEELAKSQYLYMEGYLVASPTGKNAALKAYQLAKKNNVKTSITFSDPGIVAGFRDGFLEMMGDGVDLLFCNEEEAMSFAGTDTIEGACEALKQHSKQFAITRGPLGALLYDGVDLIDIFAPEVKAVDTNGAGDMFAGCFLYALTAGHDFKIAGELACHGAAKLVTHFGARLHKEKLVSIKNKVIA